MGALVERLPGVGRVYAYPMQRDDQRRKQAHLGRLLRLFFTLFARRYHAVIDLTGGIRSTTLCLCTASFKRIGLADGRRAWSYSHRIDDEHGAHAYERYALILHAIGRTDLPAPVYLAANDESRTRVSAALAGAFGETLAPDQPLVVMHPSAGKAYRCWPPERFAAVADGLARQRNARTVIIGTPAEQEVGDRIRSAMTQPEAARYLAMPVADLLALFERCAVMVSNESGPTHLAAATDLPIVTIFGPTPEDAWRPIRLEKTVTLRGADCDPRCGKRKCFADHRCLIDLPVERVLENALAMMR